MAKSNAVRRLESILYDVSPEEYGPKLFRLNKKDQDYILGLIERNEGRGRKARSEILRLDTARREHARERRRTRGTPTIDINALRAKAYANMRRQILGKPSTVKRGVSLMTNDELQFAATATGGDKDTAGTIRNKAKQLPYVYAPDLGYEINPFWYN